MLPSTGIVPTTRSAEILEDLDAQLLVEAAHAVRHVGEELVDRQLVAHGLILPVGARLTRVSRVPRLLLLDGHSLAYRAFFALPVENFSTTTGQHTNAVYGFTSMLINVLRDEQPTHVGVAFDVSRQTFRLEQYAEYKAGRNKTPSEFSSQLPLIEEVLDALNIPFLKKDGYEADDIIATLVHPGARRTTRWRC